MSYTPKPLTGNAKLRDDFKRKAFKDAGRIRDEARAEARRLIAEFNRAHPYEPPVAR